MVSQVPLRQAARPFGDNLAMPVGIEAVDHGAVEAGKPVHFRHGRFADGAHVVAGPGDVADAVGQHAVQVFRTPLIRRAGRFLELQDDAVVVAMRHAAQMAFGRYGEGDRNSVMQVGEDRRQVAARQLCRHVGAEQVGQGAAGKLFRRQREQGRGIGADLGDRPVRGIDRKQDAMRLYRAGNVDWLTLAGVAVTRELRGAQSHDTGYGRFMAADPIILRGPNAAASSNRPPSRTEDVTESKRLQQRESSN